MIGVPAVPLTPTELAVIILAVGFVVLELTDGDSRLLDAESLEWIVVVVGGFVIGYMAAKRGMGPDAMIDLVRTSIGIGDIQV